MSTIQVADAKAFLRGLKRQSVDLIVSSPPYCVGKEYDTSNNIGEFIDSHNAILDDLVSALRPGGSLCWQVGHHVSNGVEVPLDALVYAAFATSSCLKLRNRIVWTFSHGAHCRRRFSGRHETILWFTKGDDYYFNLDAVRIPQKYPGKKSYKGPNQGLPSGNPLGKNPGDVWEIPNVKAAHVEKTDHPCQFPVALAQRLVRSLTRPGDLVVDPFMGSGSTGVAATIEKRVFAGSDINERYVSIAKGRIAACEAGTLRVRPLNQPIALPPTTHSVSRPPTSWVGERTRVLDA